MTSEVLKLRIVNWNHPHDCPEWKQRSVASCLAFQATSDATKKRDEQRSATAPKKGKVTCENRENRKGLES